MLGYDLWAGEHLNFVGEDGKEAKEGDSLTVAVNSIESKLGSWAIGYDLLKLGAVPIEEANTEVADTETPTPEKAESEEKKSESDIEEQKDSDETDKKEPEKVQNEDDTSLVDGLSALGYSSNQVDAIAEILTNIGVPTVEDMRNINKNGTLQANACEYNGHQINFTTDNGELFYVQITGWKEEISSYGLYRSAWSGKLKYGYNTQTKINTVDLYTTDYDYTGYLAVYYAETDSVHPYDE